jgi:hypothetical protein
VDGLPRRRSVEGCMRRRGGKPRVAVSSAGEFGGGGGAAAIGGLCWRTWAYTGTPIFDLGNES